jgi:hypothetical protein
VAWPECVFTDPQTANQLSLSWKQNTLDILDYIERAATPTSIEQLQATIIVSLVLQNFQGMHGVSCQDYRHANPRRTIEEILAITQHRDHAREGLVHPRLRSSSEI